MTQPTAIKPGDSLPFSFDLGGDSTDGWACQLKLKVFPTDTALIDRVIPLSSNGAWEGFLTKTETTGLSGGTQYLLIADLSNSITDESNEVVKKFYVSSSWK